MSGMLSKGPTAEPLKDLGTYGLEGITFGVERGQYSIQLTVFQNETTRLFCTYFPQRSEDSLALGWAIDYAVCLGGYGELITLRSGPLSALELYCAAETTRAIQKAAGVCP